MTYYTLISKETWLASMAPPEPHIEILQRISAGDESALTEFYNTFGQRLYAYALRLCNDSSRAEEVVQETLVTVWHSANRYRGEGKVLAWLLGIVHNLSIKSLRRKPIPITAEMETNLVESDASPEMKMQDNEQAQWIQQGLQNLSPEHRAVLELVFYQGLSLEETAQVCKCPLGTIKSRLSYARQHLRGFLIRQNMEDWR